MNDALLENGFIASAEDEIKVTDPKDENGRPKKLVVSKEDAEKREENLYAYTLDIANDYITQAIELTQKAQKYISYVRGDLKGAN